MVFSDYGGGVNLPKIMVSLDPQLKDAVDAWAADEDRSASGQVRHVLRQHIPERYLKPVTVFPPVVAGPNLPTPAQPVGSLRSRSLTVDDLPDDPLDGQPRSA
jgi:hypothetical protein